MSVVEIMDLTQVSRNFPAYDTSVIERENIINTLDVIFEGTDVIILEGLEGIGKTTFLANFARHRPHEVVSLFINSASRWAYHPDFVLFDLCNQFQWILERTPLPEDKDVDELLLANQIRRLLSRIGRRRTLYIIVDGVDQIPEEDEKYREAILARLPFGLEGFKFILSGNYNVIVDYLGPKLKVKPYQLSEFTLGEAKRFLEDLDIEADTQEEIYRTFKGIPAKLASVKRIIKAGSNVNLLLNHPNKIVDLFDIEWQEVGRLEEHQKDVLALLTFDRSRVHTVNSLGQMLNLSIDEVRAGLQDLTFVIIIQVTEEVRFISEAFRNYVANKLFDKERETTELVVEYLLQNQDDKEALLQLPALLEKVNRFEELIAHLEDPSHFENVLYTTRSLLNVQRQVEKGLHAANKVGRDSAILRFSLYRSAISELTAVSVWRSEIEARIALADYESALSLAESASLHEDRLQMLATVARAKVGQGLEPEEETIQSIKQLIDQIRVAELGDKAFEIAADLMHIDPNTAIDFIERSSPNTEEQNGLDWTLVLLSMSFIPFSNHNSRQTEAIERIRAKIEDPEAKSLFSAATSLLTRDYSAEGLIKEIETIEAGGSDHLTRFKIRLLRSWVARNRERADAHIVTEYALNLMIRSSEYPLNASDYRAIATALPFTPELRKVKELVGKIDSQKSTIEHLGPSNEYVRLQILLAQAEARYNEGAAQDRLLATFYFIDDIPDLAIKTEAMARLNSAILMDEQAHFLNVDYDLKQATSDDLDKGSAELLQTTAEQYVVTHGLIVALARENPDKAFRIASSLNLEVRRDTALLSLVRAILKAPLSKINIPFINNQIFKAFSDHVLRDIAILETIVYLRSQADNITKSVLQETLPVVYQSKTIGDAARRCNALCVAYTFLMEQEASDCIDIADKLLSDLLTAWNAIDIEWVKVDIGFKIARDLAKCAPDVATDYLERAEELNNQIPINSSSIANTYIYCLQLTIRAFSGLLKQRVDSKEDLEAVARLIDAIPSKGEKVKLWAELAQQLWLKDRISDCKAIVTERIRPAVQAISLDDNGYRNHIIATIAPAWYVGSQITALEAIDKLPPTNRDSALSNICRFLLTKTSIFDPYRATNQHAYKVNYDQIIDVCTLLEKLDNDSQIYSFISILTDTLSANARSTAYSFNRQQKVDIADRLEKIASRFPLSQRHIKHNGYKIAISALIAELRRNSRGFNAYDSHLNKLIEEARQIPNVADQALVLAMIAESLPSKNASKRHDLFQEALTLVEKIPAVADQVGRYADLAATAMYLETSLTESCLRAAMRLSAKSEDVEAQEAQRRIIDLAYSFNEPLAEELTGLVNDDPGRETQLKRHLNGLTLKKKIVNHEIQVPDLERFDHSQYAVAAWQLLGALHANSISDTHPERLRPFLQVAAQMPLSEAYPILSYFIENTAQRYAGTNEAHSVLRMLFQSVLQVTGLIINTASPTTEKLQRARQLTTTQPATENDIIIEAGGRDDAITWLRNWFKDNVKNYLIICDAYFGPEELEVLQLLNSVQPDCQVQILTSRKHHPSTEGSWETLYQNYWKQNISSDQDPPTTDIIIIGIESTKKSPIHDRWWITKNAGFRIGGSYKDLGLTGTTEINLLTQEEAHRREDEIRQYISFRKREYNGEKLLYNMFVL